ncbi:hypothetical protein OIU84_002727 [Salix udensis]|uniref:Uncharacterized protein n=1 Tax=Salix udensis TaxID=889485 RepID=A0AAD6K695_9ROSI|nr:hypothetical protein OIU84_002727 [Salix udensis]
MAIVIDFVALNSTDAGSDVKHPADPPNGNKPGSGKKEMRSTPPPVPQEDLKPRERSSGLVFFVEKERKTRIGWTL